MKKSLFVLLCATTLMLSGNYPVYAAPDGDITFYNASDKNITAEVSNVGRFNLAANEQKNLAYSSLEQACSSNPTSCTAQFYVNDIPAGSAMINAETGKLIYMKLSMHVRTSKSQHILRSVTIE